MPKAFSLPVAASSSDYYAARRLLRDVRTGRSCTPFRNVHPSWDCQPWAEGVEAYGHAYDLCVMHGTEMHVNYAVRADIMPAARWEQHPCVMRFPR